MAYYLTKVSSDIQLKPQLHSDFPSIISFKLSFPRFSVDVNGGRREGKRRESTEEVWAEVVPVWEASCVCVCTEGWVKVEFLSIWDET